MDESSETTLAPDALAALIDAPSPFSRGDWHGRIVALGGASDRDDFDTNDVAEVLYHYTSDDDWDGDAVGVVRMTDGRYVSWETFYGPTGDGFSEDAYGGEADIFVASDLVTILRFGLTDEGRRMLGVELERAVTSWADPDANPLADLMAAADRARENYVAATAPRDLQAQRDEIYGGTKLIPGEGGVMIDVTDRVIRG